MKNFFFLFTLLFISGSALLAQESTTGSVGGTEIMLNSTAAGFTVSNKLSYQGLLTTSVGVPVIDGSYNFKFDIYNLPSAGTLRHTETLNGVVVSRGTFSVMLHPPTTIFAESLYVEVTALAGPSITTPTTFSPRNELTTSAYSFAPWITSNDTLSVTNKQVRINYNTGLSMPLVVKNNAPGQAIFGVTRPICLIANSPQIGFNNYYAGWWKYATNGFAGLLDFDQSVNGGFGFKTAPSGISSNDVTFATKMVLTNPGYVGIGTVTPSAPLTIYSRSNEDTAQVLLIENSTGYARLMFKNTAFLTRNWTIGGQLNNLDIYSALRFRYYNGTTGSDVLSLTGDPGDASVTLPNNAISSAEILDEPGISISSPSSNFIYPPVGGFTVVDSVDITTPASGYVVITADGYLNLFHTNGTRTQVYLGIDKSRSIITLGRGYGAIIHSIPTGQATDFWSQSFSTSRTYTETAGTIRYYLNAYYSSGTNVSTNIAYPKIRAIYYPTLYGTSNNISPTMSEGIPIGDADPTGKIK
jgi:hypothetical protein